MLYRNKNFFAYKKKQKLIPAQLNMPHQGNRINKIQISSVSQKFWRSKVSRRRIGNILNSYIGAGKALQIMHIYYQRFIYQQ